MIKVGPVSAQISGRHWYYPYGGGFVEMQDAGVSKSWRFPQRFQRNVREARKSVAGLKSLYNAPERTMHEGEAESRVETPGVKRLP